MGDGPAVQIGRLTSRVPGGGAALPGTRKSGGRRIEDWTRAAPDEPQEWRDAASYNDYILRLDADQLTRMIGELTAVVERWRTETGEKPSDDARNVLMYLYPVPLPQKEES